MNIFKTFSITAALFALAVSFASSANADAGAMEHSDEHGYEKIEVPLGFIVRPIIRNIGRNIEGAGRERGEGAKVLKAITGGSVKDIEEHGILGGPNSFFRKPFG